MNRGRMMTKKRWTRWRINKYDVPGHEMNADCTHVCVCPLTDGEEGVQRFFNQPLKLFRTSKASGAGWSTTASVAHSKKKHADSDVLQYTTDNAEAIDMSRHQFQDLIVQEAVLDVMWLTTVLQPGVWPVVHRVHHQKIPQSYLVHH